MLSVASCLSPAGQRGLLPKKKRKGAVTSDLVHAPTSYYYISPACMGFVEVIADSIGDLGFSHIRASILLFFAKEF